MTVPENKFKFERHIYRTANGGGLCPWCGAYERRYCELEEEMGSCPLEDSEPDPDILRDDSHERARLAKEYPDGE
jgi:hypothetical protein